MESWVKAKGRALSCCLTYSSAMAEGVKDGFTSWLSSYLSERSIDLDVYLDYICGIAYASGEGEEEELTSSLEEVLSGPVVSGYSETTL